MPLTRWSAPLTALLLGACYVDIDIGSGDSATTSTTSPGTTSIDESSSTSAGDPICGDGKVEADEACDNGGVPGGTCTPQCTVNVCGDGFVGEGEACDDGNTADADGCASTCQEEGCGDGVTQPWESCDDGNAADGDGCSAQCALEACGDGVVQNGEECDDGNAVDDDPCTSLCKLPVCGDGLLAAMAGEECDLGPQNSDQGACTTGCKNAACGDGLLGPGEECDDGDLDALDGCGPTCARDARFAFVTSYTYDGFLNGLDGADMICQGLAASADLPGTYRAWLADEDAGPAMLFNQSALPYILPGSLAVIADSFDDLIDGAINVPIDHDEHGNPVAGDLGKSCSAQNMVWTNASAAGFPKSGVDCSLWNSGAPANTGRVGLFIHTDSRWTDSGCGSLPCSSTFRLYCFEQ